MKILIALDASVHSERALAFVSRMRWPAGSRVVVLSGTNLLLSCGTTVGLSYQVQYTTNLVASPWILLGNALPGTGTPITFTNGLTPSSQCFFKLQVLPSSAAIFSP